MIGFLQINGKTVEGNPLGSIHKSYDARRGSAACVIGASAGGGQKLPEKGVI